MAFNRQKSARLSSLVKINKEFEMQNDIVLTCAVTGAGDTTGKSAHVPVTPKVSIIVISVVMLNLGTTINTICIWARSILGRISISMITANF